MKRIIYITLLSLFILSLIPTGVLSWFVYSLYKELPDVIELTDYRYDLPTRIYDRENNLVEEYYEKKRILIKAEDLPQVVKNAVIAVEDSRFYEHSGIDLIRIAKATIVNITKGGIVEGASTITQQTAKQFLLTPEKTFRRKIKEILLALKMEQVFKELYPEKYKDFILELYLNKAFFGRRSYGIEAAAQEYFSKNAKNLKIEEAALLAGLLKAPSKLSPTYDLMSATKRRNLVLLLMERNGFITPEEREETVNTPIQLNLQGNKKIAGISYYIEEVRRIMVEKFGKEQVNLGGYNVYTAMNSALQKEAQVALENGLINIDRRHGYRGPLRKISLTDGSIDHEAFAEVVAGNNLANNQTATGVVLKTFTHFAIIDFGQGLGLLRLKNMDWAREADLQTTLNDMTRLKQITKTLERGDVIQTKILEKIEQTELLNQGKEAFLSADDLKVFLAELAVDEENSREKPVYDVALFQVPANNGGIISMSPQTGEVLALAGGYSFSKSQFNRVTQSKRQPGSAFKPIVYAAALDSSYTLADILEDTPLVFKGLQQEHAWIPKNYNGLFLGNISFRNALVKSKNVPTVKIANDIGVRKILILAEKLGIDIKDIPANLSISLGSGSVTLEQMIIAYGAFANMGKRVKPIYITSITDRDGNMIEEFLPEATQVISPATAFLMSDILKDVVNRGTGRLAQAIKQPSAGKTGTTSLNTDAWYIGFVSDLITGVYVGNDKPIIPLGQGETGSKAALPIWVDYMTLAVQGLPVKSIHPPRNIKKMRINQSTGLLACENGPDQIFEYFKLGTEPTECFQSPINAEATELIEESIEL